MGRLAREFHLEELLSSCRGRPLVRDRGKGHGHPRCVGRLGAPLPLALVPSLAQPLDASACLGAPTVAYQARVTKASATPSTKLGETGALVLEKQCVRTFYSGLGLGGGVQFGFRSSSSF